jgi:hypothetical protein
MGRTVGARTISGRHRITQEAGGFSVRFIGVRQEGNENAIRGGG